MVADQGVPVRKKEGETILSIALAEGLHEKLRRRARREERTIKAVVVKALREYLKTPAK